MRKCSIILCPKIRHALIMLSRHFCWEVESSNYRFSRHLSQKRPARYAWTWPLPTWRRAESLNQVLLWLQQSRAPTRGASGPGARPIRRKMGCLLSTSVYASLGPWTVWRVEVAKFRHQQAGFDIRKAQVILFLETFIIGVFQRSSFVWKADNAKSIWK